MALLDDERIDWPGDPRPARSDRRPSRTDRQRLRRRRRRAAAAAGTPITHSPANPVSQANGSGHHGDESFGTTDAPVRRTLRLYYPDGDDGTSALREPWRFDERNKLDGRGQSPTAPNQRAYSATLSATDRGYKYRVNHRLIVKARALGLPVVEYDNTLSMAIRRMRGGRAQFVNFLALAAEAGDEDAKKFIQIFSEVKPSEQPDVSLDLICITAGVSRVDLLKTAIGIAFENQVDVSKLVEVSTLPALVDRAIESAMKLDSATGQRDRMALLQHHGLMPAPKSTVINVTATAAAQAAASASSEPSVPSFLQDVDVATGSREAAQRSVTEVTDEC